MPIETPLQKTTTVTHTASAKVGVATEGAIKIVHLLYRLDIGGLERFMVDMINRFHTPNYEHIVVCLTAASDFSQQLPKNVPVYELHKAAGLDWSIHRKLFDIFKKEKPDFLHSYNLATAEYHLVARLAGLAAGVHAEHGRDASDPLGKNWKHRLLRKFMAPLVHRIVSVSSELSHWLQDDVGISAKKIATICNGVDTHHYRPAEQPRDYTQPIQFAHVARLEAVKNQKLLLQAFQTLLDEYPQATLNIYGDGPEKAALAQWVMDQQLGDRIVLQGLCRNVVAALQQNHVFVLSSIAEGTPMTMLEAMACEMPVISSRVGGIPDAVEHGVCGRLYESEDVQGLVSALQYYCENPDRIGVEGKRARTVVEERYSVEQCDQHYRTIYHGISSPGTSG